MSEGVIVACIFLGLFLVMRGLYGMWNDRK